MADVLPLVYLQVESLGDKKDAVECIGSCRGRGDESRRLTLDVTRSVFERNAHKTLRGADKWKFIRPPKRHPPSQNL
jgi:hypothetical protein